MGLAFLRHVERARILLILLDGATQNIGQQYEDTMRELRAYEANLPPNKIVIINKSDECDPAAHQAQKYLMTKASKDPVRQISVKTMQGVAELQRHLEFILENTALNKSPRQDMPEPKPTKRIDPKIRRRGRVFILEDEGAERITALADTSDWRVKVQVRRELIRKGLVRLLEEEGIQAGDTLRIGMVEMEW